MSKCIIKWHKLNSKAVIPNKTKNAAGFDIYTIEDYVAIPPHSQYMFSTGIGYVIEGPYWLMAFDRGSTGSQGLHVHCGVCDKDYRGEVFICIKNDNDYPVIITRSIDKAYKVEKEIIGDYYCGPVFYYPACKGIAQLIPIKMPKVKTGMIGVHGWELAKEQSARKDGKLGSSGK